MSLSGRNKEFDGFGAVVVALIITGV